MILWLIKRKLRRRRSDPVETQITEHVDPREEHFANRLSFGMMKACYFSSKAVAEAKGGPLAVLRNERGERITARVEAPYIAPR